MEKKRIGYLDAMRGFTMILVVYNHVLGHTFGYEPAFSFNDIFITFRMPLFFFLSGFLMYKSNRFSDGAGVLDFLSKKAQVQLLPTLVFTIVFFLIFQYSFGDLWFEKAKCGYWFTITLFYYFCFYSIGDRILGRFLHGKRKLCAGALFAVLVYAFSKYSLSSSCPWADSFLCGFVGYANLQYFIFFFFGAAVKAYFDPFQRMLDNQAVSCAIVSSFVVVQLLLQLPQTREWIITIFSYSAYSLIKTLAGFLGILLVFSYFRRNGHHYEHSRIGAGLQTIGVRTLDIYLIHLLLIRTDLTFVGDFLAAHANPLLEFIVATAVSVILILISLVISNILRSSDILAKLLFGKVIQPTDKTPTN